MAQYQREFLVNYLRDASALHFALHKLQERLIALDHQRRSLEKGIHRKEYPTAPRYEASNGVFLLFLGLFMFLTGLALFLSHVFAMGWFCILVSIMCAIVGLIRYVRVTRENTLKEENYHRKLESYQEAQRKNEQERQTIPAIVSEMEVCQTEIQRVWKTLHRVYRANIIPKSCRSMSATVFLFNWFISENPNDLPMATEAFQLEETKAKLDLLLLCHKEIIMDRYLQLTEHKDEETPPPQSLPEHMAEEDRDACLAMIESNRTTAAYFATADYLLQIWKMGD